MTAFTIRFFINSFTGIVDEVILRRHVCDNHATDDGLYTLECSCGEYADEDFCRHIDRSLGSFDPTNLRLAIPVSPDYEGPEGGGRLGDEDDAAHMRDFILKHGYIEVL